jgi:hypothetical protein
LIIKWVSSQEARNSQQSGTSFLQAMCKGVSLSYCSFYRPPNYQDSSHLISKFTGGLGHFFRDNDNAADINNNRWQKNLQFPFGAELGQIDAVSLIQSNFSAQGNGPGNLGLVARVRDRLYYFFKPDAPPGLWQGPFIFAIDV